jgi:hypothetical protein
MARSDRFKTPWKLLARLNKDGRQKVVMEARPWHRPDILNPKAPVMVTNKVAIRICFGDPIKFVRISRNKADKFEKNSKCKIRKDEC